MDLSEVTLAALEKIKTRTIVGVEYGPFEPSPLAHRGQVITLHFADETAVSIVTGTNAGDFCDEPSRLRVDLTAVFCEPAEEVLRPVTLEELKASATNQYRPSGGTY